MKKPTNRNDCPAWLGDAASLLALCAVLSVIAGICQFLVSTQ